MRLLLLRKWHSCLLCALIRCGSQFEVVNWPSSSWDFTKMSRKFSSRLRTWRIAARRSSSSYMAMSPLFVLYRRHWLGGSEIVSRLTRKLTRGSRTTCLRRRSFFDGMTDQNRDANTFTAGVTSSWVRICGNLYNSCQIFSSRRPLASTAWS